MRKPKPSNISIFLVDCGLFCDDDCLELHTFSHLSLQMQQSTSHRPRSCCIKFPFIQHGTTIHSQSEWQGYYLTITVLPLAYVDFSIWNPPDVFRMQIENRGCKKKKVIPQKTRVIEDPLRHISGRRLTILNMIHIFSIGRVPLHSTKSRL